MLGPRQQKAAGPDVWGDEEETKRDESKATADSSAGGWGGDLLADIGLDMSSSAGMCLRLCALCASIQRARAASELCGVVSPSSASV